ncbi:MAG: insulinase family protein [Cryobacterium sp.]|nr:insulinase family protein [Oligoflexia bacterium]
MKQWKFQRFLPSLVLILSFSCASSPRPAQPLVVGQESAATRAENLELDRLGLRFPLVQKKLSNGLKILVAEDHTVPIVAYQTWVNVGSVDEKFGLTGMAHLFEHLMFKDSEKYGPRAFFNRLEAKGASVNAFTTRDYTVFYETMVPTLLQTAIDLESDRLMNLKVDNEALFTERQVVFEERRMRTENSPEGRMQEAIWALLFRSHPYRWPVIGYEEDLKRMELKDLEDFFATYYQPGNVTVVVAGDVKADAVFSQIEKAYGSIPGKGRPKRPVSAEPIQAEARRQELKDAVASEKVTLAYPSTSASQEDTYALDVLSNILFSGNSSRGYREIVENQDLALALGGVNYTPLYPGLFLVSATLKSGRSSAEFERAVEALITDVQTKGVTETEIRTAVRQLTVQTVDSVRTSQGLANLIGTVDAIFGDPTRFKEDLAKYAKVTSADVVRVARMYLIPARKNVVTLVPNRKERVHP